MFTDSKTSRKIIVFSLVIIIIGYFGVTNAALWRANDLRNMTSSSLYSGLVGWWTFDGGDMLVNVLDKSQNGNNGNIVSPAGTATSTLLTAGKSGQAWNGDGLTGANAKYVSVPRATSLNLTGPLTISAWVYPKAGSNTGWVGKSTLSSTQPDYSISFNVTNDALFRLNGGAQDLGSTANSVPYNKWTHVVGTYDMTNQKIYINGKQNNSVGFSSAVQDTANSFVHLGVYFSTGFPFNGMLDDVRIYNRALTAAEVDQLYKNSRTTFKSGYFTRAKSGLAPYFYDGVTVGNLDFTVWTEISDIVAPKKSANSPYLWVISDGIFNPLKMLAIKASDATSQGEWTLTSAVGSDIEALASATIGGQPYVWVGDIGDNAAARTTINIFRVKEPTITGSNGSLTGGGVDYDTIVCDYPASPVGEGGTARRDAEAMFADPATGDLYIMSKRTSTEQVFRLPWATTYSGTQTLTYLGDMYLIASSSQASGANNGRAVAASISPDGTEILVKTYTTLYLFKRVAGQTIYQALNNTPTIVGGYVGGGRPSSHPNNEPQGEGVTFDYNGQNIYTASEYVATFDSGITDYPLFKYVRLGKAYNEVSFQEGVNSYAGTSDTYISSLLANQGTNFGAATTFISDWNSATDERRALLKFDISSIPTNATVVGADLQLYIDVEGSTFATHKMIQSWVESDTYTSLGGLPAFDDIHAAIATSTIHGDFTGLTATTTIKLPVSLVQEWVTTPANNQGIVIYSNDIPGGNGEQFRSSEHTGIGNRPKLTIRYITN